MAVTGRKPKQEKINHHPLSHDWTEVDDLPYTGWRPSLWKGVKRETRAWWNDVSRMPHCVLWTRSQWRFAVDTARIHQAFIEGDMARAGELRMREAILGTTLDALRNLRIRYREPLAKELMEEPESPPPESTPDSEALDFAAARKRRLTSAG